jgi:hypothetical protein
MNRVTKALEQFTWHLASAIAPRERAGWIAAMIAEADHIPPDRRARFAVGCAVAAIHARVAAPQFARDTLHALLVTGGLAWAALNIRFAGLPVAAEHPGMPSFGFAMAVMFAVGVLAAIRRGPSAVIVLAGAAVLIAGAALLAIKFTLPATPENALWFALLAEDLTVLLVAVITAAAVIRLGKTRKELPQ